MTPAPAHGAAAKDAARLALGAGCAWIAIALARHAFAPDAGVGAPSVLLGGVAVFGTAFVLVWAERAWAQALARREARTGGARTAVAGERLAFDGSLPAPRGEPYDGEPARRAPRVREKQPRA